MHTESFPTFQDIQTLLLQCPMLSLSISCPSERSFGLGKKDQVSTRKTSKLNARLHWRNESRLLPQKMHPPMKLWVFLWHSLATFPSDGVQSCAALASASHQGHCPWNFNHLQASFATSPVTRHKVSQRAGQIKVCTQAGGWVLSLCHTGCPFLLQSAHHQQPKDLQLPVRGSSLTLPLNLDNELKGLDSNLAEFTIDNIVVGIRATVLAQSRALGSISSNYFRGTSYNL